MNKRDTCIATLAAACLLLAGACSDDDGDSPAGKDSGGGGADLAPDMGVDLAPPCPSLAGKWKVSKHCDPTYLGVAVTIQQLGCGFTLDPPFTGWAGTIDKQNQVTLSGAASGHNLSCAGALSGKTIILNCTYDKASCAMEMTRQ